MNNTPFIDIVIPAFNEEDSIAKVIGELPPIVREVVVSNNGSTDETKERALQAGATVIDQPEKGYGAACLAALEYIHQKDEKPDIVAFIDGDYSDYPAQLTEIVQPIIDGKAELVIGSRALGKKQKGAMMPQQIFGNWLATTLLKLFYNVRFTDLGPFRAITYKALQKIKMQDRDFGWTVEMQLKAAKLGIKCAEVPVDYRKRIGVSKVTGTLKGTVMAGYKILWTIARYRF